MKKCNKCNRTKNLNKFYKDKTRRDGYSYYCKDCDNKKSRLNSKLWNEKNKKACNIFYWNRRAKNHNISGARLKKIYLGQNKKCLYCGVSLSPYNFHIEHTIPKDDKSIAISCGDCNRLKWTRTKIEFIKFLKEYTKRFDDCGQPTGRRKPPATTERENIER